MKNHRFPWLRNRTTDNRKCEKARNIKEKRTIEMFSTVSRRLVALPSSPSADFVISYPGKLRFSGVFLLFLFYHRKIPISSSNQLEKNRPQYIVSASQSKHNFLGSFSREIGKWAHFQGKTTTNFWL